MVNADNPNPINSSSNIQIQIQIQIPPSFGTLERVRSRAIVRSFVRSLVRTRKSNPKSIGISTRSKRTKSIRFSFRVDSMDLKVQIKNNDENQALIITTETGKCGYEGGMHGRHHQKKTTRARGRGRGRGREKKSSSANLIYRCMYSEDWCFAFPCVPTDRSRTRPWVCIDES